MTYNSLNTDPASPWSGMPNANGEFAPALTNVPEPRTLVLLTLAGGMMLRRRR
jgi:hypothetical protein